MLKKLVVSLALLGSVFSTQVSQAGVLNIIAVFAAPEAATRVAYAVNAAFDLTAGIKLVKYSRNAGDGWGKFLGWVLIVLGNENAENKLNVALQNTYGISAVQASAVQGLLVSVEPTATAEEFNGEKVEAFGISKADASELAAVVGAQKAAQIVSEIGF